MRPAIRGQWAEVSKRLTQPIGPPSMFPGQTSSANKSPADVPRRYIDRHKPRPAGRDPTPGKLARVPRISGQKPMFLNDKTRSAARGPHVAGAGARAMFLSNIYIKFDLAYNYLIKQYIIP